ncbi:YceI family protein [Aquimarina brevivitae]|uniref:YceI-like domain-containing protein n=1 Tax=Aquimarina brevivitae TaxID=323412 RepID=A0A4Q7P1N8_9FLAO|nr:YceI family protein [Aquimarina brevivitae]RZS93487.1 YceI-like domain-containing protein [Aquimarina brevivitae]
MKYLILYFSLLLLSPLCLAQKKYYSSKGKIAFNASSSSIVEIKAINSNVSAILNTENGTIAVLSLLQKFKFKNGLMEEHFNENYVESDKYPKATFQGTLENFEPKNIQKSYRITGILSLHGISKEISVNAIIERENNLLLLSSKFFIAPEDFGIDVPRLISYKLADRVSVELSLPFSEN